MYECVSLSLSLSLSPLLFQAHTHAHIHTNTHTHIHTFNLKFGNQWLMMPSHWKAILLSVCDGCMTSSGALVPFEVAKGTVTVVTTKFLVLDSEIRPLCCTHTHTHTHTQSTFC